MRSNKSIVYVMKTTFPENSKIFLIELFSQDFSHKLSNCLKLNNCYTKWTKFYPIFLRFIFHFVHSSFISWILLNQIILEFIISSFQKLCRMSKRTAKALSCDQFTSSAIYYANITFTNTSNWGLNCISNLCPRPSWMDLW